MSSEPIVCRLQTHADVSPLLIHHPAKQPCSQCCAGKGEHSNRSAVPDCNKRQRIVRAMERISRCAHASRDETGESTRPAQVGRRRLAHRPHRQRKRHDCDGRDRHQTFQPLITRDHSIPVRSGRRTEAHKRQGHDHQERQDDDQHAVIQRTAWTGQFGQEDSRRAGNGSGEGDLEKQEYPGADGGKTCAWAKPDQDDSDGKYRSSTDRQGNTATDRPEIHGVDTCAQDLNEIVGFHAPFSVSRRPSDERHLSVSLTMLTTKLFCTPLPANSIFFIFRLHDHADVIAGGLSATSSPMAVSRLNWRYPPTGAGYFFSSCFSLAP